jgi:hypothetical protein
MLLGVGVIGAAMRRRSPAETNTRYRVSYS